MFFVVPTPSYPRATAERAFKVIYGIGNLAHLLSVVVIATEFYSRFHGHFSDLFSFSELVVHKSFKVVMDACISPVSMSADGEDTAVPLTRQLVDVALRTMSQYVAAVIVVEILAILNGAFSAANYSSGKRHLRIFNVHVPLYHILLVFSFVYAIALIVMVITMRQWKAFYSAMIRNCEAHLNSTNRDKFLGAEYDEYHSFNTPLEWALAASVVQLFLSFAGCVALFVHSRDPALRLLSESDAPWEGRDFCCTTDKAVLQLHTKARASILQEAREAMARGEHVRIVRSYALMTAADYDAQVEAMRARFTDADREQQFEQMCGYIGASGEDSPPPPPDEFAERMAFTQREPADRMEGAGAASWSELEIELEHARDGKHARRRRRRHRDPLENLADENVAGERNADEGFADERFVDERMADERFAGEIRGRSRHGGPSPSPVPLDAASAVSDFEEADELWAGKRDE